MSCPFGLVLRNKIDDQQRVSDNERDVAFVWSLWSSIEETLYLVWSVVVMAIDLLLLKKNNAFVDCVTKAILSATRERVL